MRNLMFACVVLSLLLSAPTAQADSGFYLNGKLGATSFDDNLDRALNQVVHGDDESVAVGVGLRLGDHLAFELAYADLGSATGTSSACSDPTAPCIALVVPVEADTSALSLSFLPHLPISDSFFTYGKLGVVSWETKLTEVLPGFRGILRDHSGEDLVYGLGVRYLFPGPAGVFAEIERFGDGFDTVSLGATLGF